MIPDKCKDWKVASSPLTKWWCKLACGGLTKGKICEPWCRIVERYGMWTLILTLGLPTFLIVWLTYYSFFK